MRSDAPTAPYLRATTLSRFDGDVWEPDRVRTVPLENDEALGARRRGSGHPGRRVRHERRGDRPRVALAARALPGDRGQRTRRAVGRPPRTTGRSSVRPASTQGQNYEVVTNVPRPTLEQIRAPSRRRTRSARRDDGAARRDLADRGRPRRAKSPPGTTNDYDALVALQAWFRGSEFRYSLDAPVEDGFDGSGTDAVAKFLEVREGYCIHYASAFALMARTLGMPSRIVVGYLPGSATTDAIERRDDLLGLERPAARVAGGAVRGDRLGAVRADERARRADDASRGRFGSRRGG